MKAGCKARLDALTSRGAIIVETSSSLERAKSEKVIFYKVSAAAFYPQHSDSLMAVVNAVSCKHFRNDNEARAWLKVAIDLERIELGMDKEVFEEEFGVLMRRNGPMQIFESC